MEKVQEAGDRIIGSSSDIHAGALFRPGRKEMIRHVWQGEVDCICIPDLGTISRRWYPLIAFLREVENQGVTVQTGQYSLRYVANYRGIGEGMETRPLRKGAACHSIDFRKTEGICPANSQQA